MKYMESEQIKHFVLCECGGEGILISRWLDENELSFSIWKYFNMTGYSWKFRLKWGLRFIFKGRFFGDSVILSPEKVDNLIKALQEARKELK